MPLTSRIRSAQREGYRTGVTCFLCHLALELRLQLCGSAGPAVDCTLMRWTTSSPRSVEAKRLSFSRPRARAASTGTTIPFNGKAVWSSETRAKCPQAAKEPFYHIKLAAGDAVQSRGAYHAPLATTTTQPPLTPSSHPHSRGHRGRIRGTAGCSPQTVMAVFRRMARLPHEVGFAHARERACLWVLLSLHRDSRHSCRQCAQHTGAAYILF